MAKTVSADAILNSNKNKTNIAKHAKRIQVAESVQKKFGKTMDLEKKVALATVLENTQKIMEATNSSNIPSKTFFMDMITGVIPNLIASDIVSTQAMEAKASIVSYLRYTYGTDKGATQAGTMFNNSLYTGRSDMNYSSRVVADEQVLDGVNFEFAPILPGTVNIKLNETNNLARTIKISLPEPLFFL